MNRDFLDIAFIAWGICVGIYAAVVLGGLAYRLLIDLRLAWKERGKG